MKTSSILLTTIILLLLPGCGPPPAAPLIPGRFAADIGCAKEDIDVTELAPNSYRARGCGREASYTCVTNTYDRWFYGWSCIREAPLSATK